MAEPSSQAESPSPTHAVEPSVLDSIDMDPQQPSSDLESGRLLLPVWLQEASSSFRWRWVPLPLRQSARSVGRWSRGPSPPKIQRIAPFFPRAQEAPARLVERFLPKKIYKALALAFFYGGWLLTFSLVLRRSAVGGNVEGYGVPASLWCGADYWGAGNSCGLDGNRCRPFHDSTLAFRCPANCAGLILSNSRAVGRQEIVYAPFVIGGPGQESPGNSSAGPVYRGDSFICQAAVHAGIVSNVRGGCGVVSLVGEHGNFVASRRHGIQSIGFDARFPKSYTFVSGISSDCGAVDLRWPLLAITAAFTAVLSLFTSSPAVFFASVFTLLFFHVGLVSDPPFVADYASLTSLCVGRFLPASFVTFAIYRYCVRPQLAGLTAHVEKTVLWLGGAWIGALDNYTFDFIPIQRLTPHDLAQPGARLALMVIVIMLVAIAAGQVYYLRLEGLLRRYLAVYAIMAAALLACVMIPWLQLRIHHYILALLLLPGTRLQTRPSLLYQGILVGLFVNGVARWGFDSILQTAAALQGGGSSGSLLPTLAAPVLGASNITFGWTAPPRPYDGVSVLVNDVERHRWYVGEGAPAWTWERSDGRTGHEYFRFGYMEGNGVADFTKAGTWDGRRWEAMEDGPSL